MRTIATLNAEGFTCSIKEDADGWVFFLADADVDADGANGQFGKIAAYTDKDSGSEYLANGGMGLKDGKVVFTKSWGPDIAVTDAHGNPLVVNGIVVSKTAYKFPGVDPHNPAAWVDSETVAYVVVPPAIIQGVAGVVKGCRARATYKGKSVDCVVADVGPTTKIGELSIAACRALGIPSSPKSGGVEDASVFYELWPGVEAVVNGVRYALIPS